jgi:hypothetical protein
MPCTEWRGEKVLSSGVANLTGIFFFAKNLFHVADGVGAEMENARGEDGVGFAGEQHVGHVFQRARAAAGHHRHAHGFAHAPRDDEVEPGLRAVGVNGVQNNFARAKRHGALGPFEGVEAGVLAAAVREHAPFVRRDFLGINGDDDALAAEFFRAFADEFGIRQRGGVDAEILSAPARSMVNMSSTDLMPPPTVSGMKHWSAARSITSTIVRGHARWR